MLSKYTKQVELDLKATGDIMNVFSQGEQMLTGETPFDQD